MPLFQKIHCFNFLVSDNDPCRAYLCEYRTRDKMNEMTLGKIKNIFEICSVN